MAMLANVEGFERGGEGWIIGAPSPGLEALWACILPILSYPILEVPPRACLCTNERLREGGQREASVSTDGSVSCERKKGTRRQGAWQVGMN